MYKPFVANRIGEIQSASSPDQWRYVPTDLNPADFLTRGLQVSELICKKSWWGGPDYLHGDEEAWLVSGNVSPHAMEEVKRKYQEVSNPCGTSILRGEAQGLTMVVVEKPDNETCWRLNPEQYSSWSRVIKVYSWVVRFVNNCRIDREHRIIGELTVNEIIDSEKQMIKNAQKKAFLDEFAALQKAKPLPTTSKLLKLSPKLDEDSLMRCDS